MGRIELVIPCIAHMVQYFDPIPFRQDRATQERPVPEKAEVFFRFIGTEGDETFPFPDPLNFFQAFDRVAKIQGVNWPDGDYEIKLSVGKRQLGERGIQDTRFDIEHGAADRIIGNFGSPHFNSRADLKKVMEKKCFVASDLKDG